MRLLPSSATLPSPFRQGALRMALCFIEPQDAIRVIAESVGREARRQLLGELVRAWVGEIPDQELASHYAKGVADLEENGLSMVAGRRPPRRARPVDAGGLARLAGGRPPDRQPRFPRQRFPVARRQPARGAED